MRLGLLFLLAACGRVGFAPPGAGAGDGPLTPADAAGVDGAPVTGCVTPSVSCAFPGGPPCTCWGVSSVGNAVMSEAGGSLQLTPNADTASAFAQCVRTGVPFGAAGAFLEVSRIIAGASSLTGILVGSNTDRFAIFARDTELFVEDGAGRLATVSYDPVAMRWWRIRPLSGNVIFETAPDGKVWTQFATSTRPSSAAYDVMLYGATPLGTPTPGFAQIEGINVCPP
jgi:hypothetical protein